MRARENTVTSTTTDATDTEFVGYEAAGKYVGLKKNTMSFYVHRGTGPAVLRRIPDRGYNRPVFLKSELDRWMANRPGRGFRSDLAHAGQGLACEACGALCTIGD